MALALVAAPAVFAAEESNAEKRAEIDKVAREALDEVLAKSRNAPELYKKAYGYAVFDNMRVTFIFTGGGGSGGGALGIGAQEYHAGAGAPASAHAGSDRQCVPPAGGCASAVCQFTTRVIGGRAPLRVEATRKRWPSSVGA